MPAVRVLLETGSRRVFASALDWPGWSRSGRSEAAALEALAGYAPRYAPVAGRAGLASEFEAVGAAVLEVAERLPGTATTDFGAPDAIGSAEVDPLDPTRAARAARLLEASWWVLDDAAARAPEDLRKGPRGGGRDRTPMVAHVLEAEAAYARRLGLTLSAPGATDSSGIAAQRAAILDVARRGVPLPNPRRRLWPVAYAVRRIAWHALDHAWEMEDRGA